MYGLFFELIQLAIGRRDCLSRTPSAGEWGELYRMAQRQTLVGVCFYGVQMLPREQLGGMPLALKMRWMAMAVEIQRRNVVIGARCRDLYKRISDDGYRSCLLKGQAFAALYEDSGRLIQEGDGVGMSLSLLRQPGDIDMWMMAEPEEVIGWARKTGTMYYYDFHHADLSIFAETEVELHYRPSISRNLLRNARLQRWFKGEGREHIVYDEALGCCVPDATFNIVLALNHNFWHLLYEGVGLRQMMDLYFVVKSFGHSSCSGDVTLRLIGNFGLERFAAASAWVLWHIFDEESVDSVLVGDGSPLPKPDERSGRFLLREILLAGNFGHYDDRIKGAKEGSRLRLMFRWLKHTSRLLRFFPGDVLWTPLGIMRISLWRRLRYSTDVFLWKRKR